MTEGICSMDQGSFSITYFILDFDSQEITTHLFSHVFYVLLGAVLKEKKLEFLIIIY
jgi:hypothetical protein